MMLRSSSLPFWCLLYLAFAANAFVPRSGSVFLSKFVGITSRSSSGQSSSIRSGCSTFLLAKKRRRRRSNTDPDDISSSSSSSDTTSSLPRSSPSTAGSAPGVTGGDDLPDFDLGDDDPDASKAAAVSSNNKSSPMASSSSSSSSATSEISVSPAMMASSSDVPVKSIRELLSDRSLESKLNFDDDVADAEPLPDLVELQRQKRQQQQKSTVANASIRVNTDDTTAEEGNKKKSRQTQRQAAAAARQEQEENSNNNSNNPLAKIPFLLNEKGDVAGIKIVEAGAWLGIFLLVAWELYINSPLFDRAAPLTPVVY